MISAFGATLCKLPRPPRLCVSLHFSRRPWTNGNTCRKPVILRNVFRDEGSQPIRTALAADTELKLYGEILRPQTARTQDDCSSQRLCMVRNAGSLHSPTWCYSVSLTPSRQSPVAPEKLTNAGTNFLLTARRAAPFTVITLEPPERNSAAGIARKRGWRPTDASPVQFCKSLRAFAATYPQLPRVRVRQQARPAKYLHFPHHRTFLKASLNATDSLGVRRLAAAFPSAASCLPQKNTPSFRTESAK